MYSMLGVFIGGGLGSVFRWLVCSKISNHWGTMLVNVLGAFLIGYAYTYFENRLAENPTLKLFVMTGLLGGFTTFSTYLLNFSTLVNGDHLFEAFAYLLLSIVIGLCALVLGMKSVSFFM